MADKLTHQVTLKLTEAMYLSLLHEADGKEREIPDVIRQKIADSYLGAADVTTLMRQQTLLISLMKHDILSNVAVLTRMAGIVEGFDQAKKDAEKARFDKTLAETFEVIARAMREAGL